MLVTKGELTLCCRFHLAAGAQGGVSCRGKGQVCSVKPQHKALLAGSAPGSADVHLNH